MKAGYHPAPVHHQYRFEGMPTATVKQEPMEPSGGSEHDLPMDMSVNQRDSVYKQQDSHMTSSPYRSTAHSVSLMSRGFEPSHEQERLHHRIFQSQIPTSQGKHSMSSPYGQPLYTHAHVSEGSPSRGSGSNKRKQSTPLPYPPSASSLHHPPSSQSSDTDEPMPKIPAKGDVMMNLSLGLGEDWRPTAISNEHRLQPRSSSGHQRARREFVPEEKKDTNYWCKRLKNNDSARRSRVKRKALEKLMEARLLELQKENIELRHEMAAMERRYNVKRNATDSGEDDTVSTDNTQASAGRENLAQMESHDSPSPPNVEKFSREEELECASAGSDDSRSNDDSRIFSVSTVTALHRSLGPASRERADSVASNSSSLVSIRSAASLVASSTASSKPASNLITDGAAIRLDKTGALDLSSDNSNRSTPARDSPDIINSGLFTGLGQSSEVGSLEDAAVAIRSMKNFPLKCRWKREMQSSHGSPVEGRRECQ
ncbi:nuclear factor interleukin 3 regulated-like protein [Plakobranchus ocellatus]|uniref:Nuclear factor interleukin 3 regulated-like protein n=1 Tax=Plakobranchus ocellatus TaxID=259542 RepID=A0AAV3ZRS1_9GAST|nr:nuclear factor interleukin 3 regulated-like protein [Plakobranchus ocellatus]